MWWKVNEWVSKCDRNYNVFLSISQLMTSACKQSHVHILGQPCPAQAGLQLEWELPGTDYHTLVSHVPGEDPRALNVFHHVCLVHMTNSTLFYRLIFNFALIGTLPLLGPPRGVWLIYYYRPQTMLNLSLATHPI